MRALPRDALLGKPGTYKVSFHHPNLDPRAIGDKFIGLAKLSRVEVYRPFPKKELIGTYPVANSKSLKERFAQDNSGDDDT